MARRSERAAAAATNLLHSVLTRHDDNEPDQLHSVRNATRMVVDFLVVSQADEIICIGSTNVPRLAIAIALSGKQPVVLDMDMDMDIILSNVSVMDMDMDITYASASIKDKRDLFWTWTWT